jgi:hypothetical protein
MAEAIATTASLSPDRAAEFTAIQEAINSVDEAIRDETRRSGLLVCHRRGRDLRILSRTNADHARLATMPRRYRGKDIFIWLEQSGLFDVPRQMEPSGRIEPRPLVGAVHTISLQSLSAAGRVLCWE